MYEIVMSNLIEFRECKCTTVNGVAEVNDNEWQCTSCKITDKYELNVLQI